MRSWLARILWVAPGVTLLAATGCGGGGSGGPSGGITVTGAVSGTLVLAYDSNGVKVAEAVAKGTPPTKTFAVTVRSGGTYVFFLVENEGTANQRIYPLFADGSLTTNVLAMAEPGTIDLGLIDTSSGNALPEKNPLFANGVSSAGRSSRIPPELAIAGTVFSQADLEGTWSLHGLIVKEPASFDWLRAVITVAHDGTGTYTELASSLPVGPQQPVQLSLAPGGVVGIASTDFRGFMSGSKDLIVWVTTFAAEASALGVLQRQGDSAASLPGTYQFHHLKGLSSEDPALSRGSWARGRLVVASDLVMSATEADFETSDPAHNSTVSYGGQASITDAGEVSLASNSTFHGTLSQDGDTLVATATEQGEHALLIAQRAGTGFAASDLVGTWSFRQLEFWPGTLASWSYGKAVVDSDLLATLVEVAPQPGPDGPIPVSLTEEGVLTLTGDPSFEGSLSLDGSLIVGTGSVDAGKTVKIAVMQR